jgi:hypothetical protein
MKGKKTTLNEKKKKGAEVFPLLKLGDGIHLHQKTTKEKKKKKGAQAPPLFRPSDGTIGTHT